MSNPQGIAAVILCGISFVLAVVGMAIPYWTYYSVGENWASGGLWQRCSHLHGSTNCVGLTENAYGIELTGKVYSQDVSIQLFTASFRILKENR